MADFDVGSRVLVVAGLGSGNEGVVRRLVGARVDVEVEVFGRTTTVTLPPEDLAAPGDYAAIARAKLDRVIERREHSESFTWWAGQLADAPSDAHGLIALDDACRHWLESQRPDREARRADWQARLQAALSEAGATSKEDCESVWKAFEPRAVDTLAPLPLDPPTREAARRLMERSQRAVKLGGEPNYDREREHIAAALDVHVRSGYGTFEHVRARVVEQVRSEFSLEEPETIATELTHFEAMLERAWRDQQQAEAGWPESTTNDRIDAAFETLGRRGIVALQDAGYTMSDGWEDIHEARREVDGAWGGVFFHRQDVERAVDGGGLMLAFGAFASGDDHEPESLRLANVVCEVLAQHDVATEWDGTLRKRIGIPGFDWQKRRLW